MIEAIQLKLSLNLVIKQLSYLYCLVRLRHVSNTDFQCHRCFAIFGMKYKLVLNVCRLI
jgi:hypothetical protein